MAESLDVLEDNLTCSICFEVFREPITLPCKHSYCKECLQRFAEKSKEKAGSSRKHLYAGVVISCPQCRAATDLGREGAAGLSVNVDLVESLTKLLSATRPKDSSLPCSLCEDDNKAEAVKFCPSCSLFYCGKCLSALHPMRGDMKPHILMSMKDYLSTIIPKSEDVEQTPSCDLHQQPYSIYCGTCEAIICNGCFAYHNEHTMSDMQAACEKLKAPLLKDSEETCVKLNEFLARLKDLEKDIQLHEGLQKNEILKAYNIALVALNAWKNKLLADVEKTHSAWYSGCRGAVKDLEMRREELDRIMMTSRNKNVVFLQGVKQIKISIDNQLSDIRNSLKAQRDVKNKLQSALELAGIVSRELIVTETSRKRVTQPVLKFTKTTDRKLKISDNGSVIEGENLSKYKCYTAWTDGLLQSGHISWGLEITVLPASQKCYCYTGVVREGCDVSNPGTTSWWIGIEYNNNKVICHRPGNCIVDITPGYDKASPCTGPHKLGFSLKNNERTLTVTDIDQKQLMATLRDIDFSQPVIPSVRLGQVSQQSHESMSARLFHWDSSNLL